MKKNETWLDTAIRDAWWGVGADAHAVGVAWTERWREDLADAVGDYAVGKCGEVGFAVRCTLASRWIVGAIVWATAGDAVMRAARG